MENKGIIHLFEDWWGENDVFSDDNEVYEQQQYELFRYQAIELVHFLGQDFDALIARLRLDMEEFID